MFTTGQMNMPWMDSPFFERELAGMDLPDEEKEAVGFFAKNGYLIFDPEISEDLIDRAVEETAKYRGPEKMGDGRILQGWLRSKAIREVAVSRRVQDLLRMIYRRDPIPFQTLNFSRGTEQDTHSDTIHFQSYPANFMCGVWIALEDIGAHNGPLHYYVGSHRLPLYDLFDIGLEADTEGNYKNYTEYTEFVRELMETVGLERKELELPKGRALLWAANLFHGGSPILDPSSTRYSQVTHYYFEKCAYYTPLRSSMAEQIYWRDELRDIRTGEVVLHYYLGRPFDPPPYSSGGILSRRSWRLAQGVRRAGALVGPHVRRLKRVLGQGKRTDRH